MKLSQCCLRPLIAGATLATATFSHGALIGDYGLVVFGDFDNDSRIHGNTLVGGNLTSGPNTGYGLQVDHIPDFYSPGDVSLKVGGNVTGKVEFHNNTVGEAGSYTPLPAPTGLTTGLPFDLAALYQDFLLYATSFSSYSPTGSVNFAEGKRLEFAGSNNSIEVFDVDIDQLESTTEVSFAGITSDAKVIVNLIGDQKTFNSTGAELNGIGNAGLKDRLIWNFDAFTEITLNATWRGSILAPDAQLNITNFNIYGDIYIQKGDIGVGQMHLQFFEGEFALIPEPSAVLGAMTALGLAGLLVVRRRR